MNKVDGQLSIEKQRLPSLSRKPSARPLLHRPFLFPKLTPGKLKSVGQLIVHRRCRQIASDQATPFVNYANRKGKVNKSFGLHGLTA